MLKKNQPAELDPLFRVEIDWDATSPKPAKAIWRAMHTCKSATFSLDDQPPLDAAGSVIRNALAFKHWSVLAHAFVKVDFGGFPHDTAMQFRTHQDMGGLTQSLRYCDDKFTDCANGKVPPNQLFYFASVSPYERQFVEQSARRSCSDFAMAIARGHKQENARRLLLAGYRQNFVMSGTVQAWFHVLDQRTLSDAQNEAKIAADMALNELEQWCPGLFHWYRFNRYGKNMLAP